jgi:hypothetical protein
MHMQYKLYYGFKIVIILFITVPLAVPRQCMKSWANSGWVYVGTAQQGAAASWAEPSRA